MADGRLVRVWDLPVRLFHWGLVALFAFSWWSAENREMEWHLMSGILLLALLLFRIIWGVIGGSTARYSHFVRSPHRVLAYLRGRERASQGHNPAGGYSVALMLLLLCVQVGSGLLATDIDGLDSGPLSYLLSFDASRIAAKVHGTSFNILLALVGLHILAILFYLVIRRTNLVWPMVTGRARSTGVTEDELRPAGVLPFVAAALVAGLVAWGASRGFGG
ncbi:MAG TPA: cytochrome b/b6 domain-containing protein [Sphingobium sp.]|uniref:cytochrome b/b6 domain-containing protein n=1 Tax=Sphingobium sp. TaxID=1912891 RepID=UPI002ED4C8DC